MNTLATVPPDADPAPAFPRVNLFRQTPHPAPRRPGATCAA